MHSHPLKKFFTETLLFSGCWLFLKKWNNEAVVINVTRLIILTPPIEVYPPTNLRKNFVPTKFCQVFKLTPLIIMGGVCRNHVSRNQHKTNWTLLYWNWYLEQRFQEILKKTKNLNTFKCQMKNYYFNDLSNLNLENIGGFDYVLLASPWMKDHNENDAICLFCVILAILFFFSPILPLISIFFLFVANFL